MSTLVDTKGVTPQQAEFIRHYLIDGDAAAAADKAGYSGQNPEWRLLRLPHMAAAIHAEINRRLATEAAPLAMRVGIKMLKDEKGSERVRADLAVKFLSLAGHVAPTQKDTGPQKQFSDMTPEELIAYIAENQAAIDRVEQELASRAKDVSEQGSRQHPTDVAPKPLNYLE